jgi:hypothetical protein
MEDDALLKAIMRESNRQRLHEVWVAAKAGRPLAGEEAAYAKAMLDHPEYHNAWEFADQVGAAEYVVDGANPFLHITVHVIIENQLAQGDPPEVAKTLERLLGQGMGRHGAIHAIAAAFMEVAFPAFQGREPFNTKRYIKKVRRLGRE